MTFGSRARCTLKLPHPTDELRQQMAMVEPYPEGVVPIAAELPFTAFFPGGCGLWREENGAPKPPLPVGGVMVVGHNFHNVSGYEKMRARNGRDAGSPTWRNLIKTLYRNEVPLEKCFFTNMYMGLMATDSAQGVFPGSKDAAFVSRCRAFFLTQLEMVRPRLLITLGAHVPPFLAPLSPQLREVWLTSNGKPKTVPQIDATGNALVKVHFEGADENVGEVVCLPLTHPAQQWPNVRRRRYKDLESYEAEDALLRAGWKLAFEN